jgi:hypothetical protein
MRRLCAIAFASAVLVTAGTARPDALPLPSLFNVLGSVTSAARPVANALVIALNLNSLEASQTFSGSDGHFALQLLPAGVYKIIAIKQGLAPAVTTIVPTRKDHRVALRMESEKRAGSEKNQEIWEIRGSLPPDVLRELEMAMQPPVTLAAASYQIPRLKGEMVSMTGVSDQPSNTAFAQTAVGVQSRLTDNWQLGYHGNLHRVEDPTDTETFGTPVAESSAMQMELRSSPTDA